MPNIEDHTENTVMIEPCVSLLTSDFSIQINQVLAYPLIEQHQIRTHSLYFMHLLKYLKKHFAFTLCS